MAEHDDDLDRPFDEDEVDVDEAFLDADEADEVLLEVRAPAPAPPAPSALA